MTIMHHPSDPTLAAFASGTLDEARAVVVATHIALCAQCRGAVAKFEAVGGADDLAPARPRNRAHNAGGSRAAARTAPEAAYAGPCKFRDREGWNRIAKEFQRIRK